MKKIFFIFLFIFLALSPVFAINIGSYKTETEYGLIDGFSWKIFNHKKGEAWVQLKSETKEEQERLEKLKNKPKEEQDEIQLFRFMNDGIVAY